MRYYLESSVALHAVLPGGDSRARDWLDGAATRGDEVFSSVLLHLEMTRVLRREQLDPSRARLVMDRVSRVSIDDGIIRVAAAIEPHVKSLDAIHLATCSLLGSNVTLVSHDTTMREVAGQLGIDDLDPLHGDRPA